MHATGGSHRVEWVNSQQETGGGDNGALQIEEIKSVDFVCKLVGLIDIYNIIVKASVFVQNVDKYPWEYDDAIRRLQECLNNYARLLEQLDLNTTQEMDSIEEYQQDSPVTSHITTTTIDDDVYDNIDIERDEEELISATPSTMYMEQYYQSLFNCIFRERPITRRKELIEAIETRFKDTPSISLLMKNCLDVSSLYEQVVLTGQQKLADYDATAIQQQYAEWKQRCLLEIEDKDTFDIWTTNGKIITPKVMKTFYTNKKLADGIHDFLYFYSLMILKISSEAICESVSSILKGHIHNNRSLQHTSLDEEVMLHWNAPPLHSADLFITSSLNEYFSHTKDRQWLFYKKKTRDRNSLLSDEILDIREDKSIDLILSTKTWYDDFQDENIVYSTATTLILTNSLTFSYDEILFEKINRVLAITQIYHLIIIDKHSSIHMLIDIISSLPKLITFKLHSISSDDRTSYTIKEFNTVCSINVRSKITKVYIEELNNIDEFHCITMLCPCIKYYKVKHLNNMNIQLFLRTILENLNKICIHYIRSLYFHVPVANDQMIENLQQMIKYEQPFLQLTIKRIVDDICLQWK
ncbi:unnamed protein product [Rotaria sordida]|uniref:Uncharacterized protein n=1 Tax=Rotaria sordida TaxID=392033 RepID=A0A815HCT0_9BILA|nr:unnamed protein product [Rotaria sordida]